MARARIAVIWVKLVFPLLTGAAGAVQVQCKSMNFGGGFINGPGWRVVSQFEISSL